METEADAQTLKRVWRQGELPVVFRRESPHRLLVKVPSAAGNMEWLRGGRRIRPIWSRQYSAWELPRAWLESVVRSCLARYARCYVVQMHRERQVCAPACWNAHGVDCECSCMGAHHGNGHPSGRWYEIDETLALSWGDQRYACRLLRIKSPARAV